MKEHAQHLIETVRRLGAEIELRHGEVNIRPVDRLPAELLQGLMRNRGLLLACLLRECEWRKSFTTHGLNIERATQLTTQVLTDGCVPVWSDVLDDLVYFCRDEESALNAPRGVPAYTMEEISLLYGDSRWQPTDDALRLINVAKQYGGKIIDVHRSKTEESSL